MSTRVLGLQLSTVASSAIALAVVGYGAHTVVTGTDSHPPLLQAIREGTVEVLQATYGSNCRPDFDVAEGNATRRVGEICNGETKCDYMIDVIALGDPARGCEKDFQVSWRCAASSPAQTGYIPSEANKHSLLLTCGN